MKDQKDLKPMKTNKIENHGENVYKMTDLGEKNDQLRVKLSVELNVTVKNRFLSAERGVNKMGIKGIQRDWKMPKKGVNHGEVPYRLQVWECSTTPNPPPRPQGAKRKYAYLH